MLIKRSLHRRHHEEHTHRREDSPKIRKKEGHGKGPVEPMVEDTQDKEKQPGAENLKTCAMHHQLNPRMVAKKRQSSRLKRMRSSSSWRMSHGKPGACETPSTQ